MPDAQTRQTASDDPDTLEVTNERRERRQPSAPTPGDVSGSVVVTAEGELDLVGAPRLLEAIPGPGDEPVVLDLGSVGFMDSPGLRSLLEARQACLDGGPRASPWPAPRTRSSACWSSWTSRASSTVVELPLS